MQTAKFTLVYTNDLHSNFDLWPHTATVIRQEVGRAESEGRPVAYLDAGDHLDMSQPITYFTRGYTNLWLLVLLGCRAFTLGNNEVRRLPKAELSRLATRGPFPWLAANLREPDGEPVAGLHDYTLLNFGPVKVGILGLTPEVEDGADLGYRYRDDLTAIHEATEDLRELGAQVIIFLSHLGLVWDRRFAAEGLDVDLIIGGHTHDTLYQPESVEGIPIVQAGSMGRFVGVVDLTYDTDTNCLTDLQARLVPVDESVPPDLETLRILKNGRQAADEAMAEVLTSLPADLPHDPTGHSTLTPFIAEALRRFTGADIGLCPGGQAVKGLKTGPVTRKDLADSLQSLWNPGLLEMTGSQITELLAQSDDPSYHGVRHIAWGVRPRGTPIGRIGTAGISGPLVPDRIYTVAAPTFLGIPDCGYPAVQGARLIRRYVPQFVREVFEQALREGLADSLTP